MLLVIATIEAKPGQSRQLLNELKAYIDVVLAEEAGTLFFEVCESAFESSGAGENFKILEGYVDQAAYDAHQAMHYRTACLKRIRSHVANGSAQQYESID